ncbi:hypothetical protein BJY21_000145 [Kineosphaera limosa]|uniref:Uncharacterized protein n=1 Tax=Kineosphaera limosa NBRC 100340 TaxID=1184609 RepID=K6XG86_9MICO|nr:hypothetical protein [Kineosphaera limosa]NYD98960.1 hypothetical protein [Kineosphaera limosa]GAB97819.1 hypothetical protein KILIM_083_00150 [Kineosphaera limosa NBRC 100340]
MSELSLALLDRTHEALQALDQARLADDEVLTHVRLGELNSLARTAADHEIDMPELAPFRSLSQAC